MSAISNNTSSGSFEKGRHLPGLVAVTAKNEESPSKLPVKMHDPSPCSFIHMISRSRPAFLKLMCKHASHRPKAVTIKVKEDNDIV